MPKVKQNNLYFTLEVENKITGFLFYIYNYE
jgi:hypothetical protein